MTTGKYTEDVVKTGVEIEHMEEQGHIETGLGAIPDVAFRPSAFVSAKSVRTYVHAWIHRAITFHSSRISAQNLLRMMPKASHDEPSINRGFLLMQIFPNHFN